MGNQKKRFNAKARTQTTVGARYNVANDLTTEGKGQIINDDLKISDSNQLLLVAKDVKVSKRTQNAGDVKPKYLSKRQRKHAEKIAERKVKAAKRGQLLEELSKFQVSKAEQKQLYSTASIGQVQKRKIAELEEGSNIAINSVQGKKKRKNVKDFHPIQTTTDHVSDDEDSSLSESSDNDDVDDKSENDVEVKQSEETDTKDVSKPPLNSITSAEVNDSKIKEEAKPVIENVTKAEEKQVCPAVYVQVNRKNEINTARLLLPILAEEQVIMETIKEHDVVVICGETGSGKTTQIPQFLFEAGYGTHDPHSGLIGVTQPRRVAAVNMSKRVAEEMNMSQRKVSYQIRYEGNATDETVVKFMTDGVLLKEMETDFLLTKYSALIIDEAHERSVFTDILIGLLSRVVPLRNKQGKHLKLIIMSATLRTEDFTANALLFPSPPPVLKVDARQYPVSVHFNRQTKTDYMSEAYRKICKIHRTLKDGGILVFLTGQNEIHALCKKLKKTFPEKSVKETETEGKSMPKFDLDRFSAIPDEYHNYKDEHDDEEDDLNDSSDDETDSSAYMAATDATLPMRVLPLYSLLSPEKQAKVFASYPDDDARLCVIATNVAETSLTIPGIKYVVDTGKVKRKVYDKMTGVTSFNVTWTSKASANQRAGRAGRVEAGHCYRLFSSAVFVNEFEDFSPPEILRRPVDDLVLQMKSMNIEKVVNFPFPTPPDKDSLLTAESLLVDLGALKLEKTTKGPKTAVITSVGQKMAKLPVSPRFSKMISLAMSTDVLSYIITIVSALTVKEIFSDNVSLPDNENGSKEIDAKTRLALVTQARRRWAGSGPSALLGDLMVILRAVGACEYSNCSLQFCNENGLRQKAMMEIRKLRIQLSNAVSSLSNKKSTFVDPRMKPPTEDQAILIRQIILSGMGDQVARKIPPSEVKELKIKNAYMCMSSMDPVFIHPSSALFTKLPEYVVYQEIIETSKVYIKGVMAVEAEWFPVHVSRKCRFGKPMDEPSPRFDKNSGKVVCFMTSTFGPHGWTVSPCELQYPEGKESCRWFGRFLLEGDVFPKLKSFTNVLLTPPPVIVKSWSNLQPRTHGLLTALLSRNVNSKKRLVAVWNTDKEYLLDAYKEWVPEEQHPRLQNMWPPIDD